jgi:hypothetical protein
MPLLKPIPDRRQPTSRIPLRAIRRLVDSLEPVTRRHYEGLSDSEDTEHHLYHAVRVVSRSHPQACRQAGAGCPGASKLRNTCSPGCSKAKRCI